MASTPADRSNCCAEPIGGVAWQSIESVVPAADAGLMARHMSARAAAPAIDRRKCAELGLMTVLLGLRVYVGGNVRRIPAEHVACMTALSGCDVQSRAAPPAAGPRHGGARGASPVGHGLSRTCPGPVRDPSGFNGRDERMTSG
ncbi:hypothetical protein SSP531S_38030 [Streptomyces spongiicola]|uniref:Uncharacterized protein n=1 Tax=Streptomyces spongiicola TaxID=1690221 RepID=A0A388T253_9ACTN|nr:hypothetical protein SSP531S_38030 [Streptomyces spongiicola]